jgi:hypothetical protein
MVQPVVFLSIYFILYLLWLTYLLGPGNLMEGLSDVWTLDKNLTGFVGNCVTGGNRATGQQGNRATGQQTQ